MKIFIITALLQFATPHLFGQNSINNTKWNAHVTIPQTIDVRLEFARDTYDFYYPFLLNGRVAEASYFLQRNDSLLIRKLSGVTPCSTGYEAWYKIEWIENGTKFLFHNLNDTCRQRVNSWTSLRID